VPGLAVKSDPPVGCLGPKATRPWAASGSKATRRWFGSPTFPDLFFPNEINAIVQKRPAGGSIRGKNLPFPYGLGSAHSASACKGHPKERVSSGVGASMAIDTGRPTIRAAPISGDPDAAARPILHPEEPLTDPTAGNQAPAISRH
jgi:hypothetical protein